MFTLRLPGNHQRALKAVACLVLLLYGGYGLAAEDTSAAEDPAAVPPNAAEVLPPLPEQFEQDERLSALPRIQVNQFRFEGNTVFTESELRVQVAEWENRWLTSRELQEVQARLTRYYVENGYVTSGALVPDQEVRDGIVTLRIIEGHITAIEIEGEDHLRPAYLEGRLATGVPLQVGELQQDIQLLQQNPMVKRINVQVAPGPAPGENVLRARVEEESPYAAGMVFDNSRSPTIGSNQLELWAMQKSLFGWGDRLEARYGINDGPNGYLLGYSLPLNARDTTLATVYEKNDSLVIEEPFDEIDLESRFNRAEVSLRHPFLRTVNREFALALGLEWRHAETFLLSERYSFAAGVDNGETKVTLVHFVQEWLERNTERLIAIRSDIRWGVDLFDATTHSDGPDGRYLGWLGQFQWIQSLPVLDSKLVVRGLAQWVNDSLLPSEKISIGGMETVRGYRENFMTTDKGLAAGIEWQVPVGHLRIPGISTGIHDGLFELAAFFDHGRGANKSFPNPDPDSISSVGLGMIWHPGDKLLAKLYWGYALQNRDNPDDHDLQDDGVSFVISARFL
ncbi:MAG: ShlB/FhaC/HecB family hemolysin secretion/activation protein [Gammaproteobacteria bacterium]